MNGFERLVQPVVDEAARRVPDVDRLRARVARRRRRRRTGAAGAGAAVVVLGLAVAAAGGIEPTLTAAGPGAGPTPVGTAAPETPSPPSPDPAPVPPDPGAGAPVPPPEDASASPAVEVRFSPDPLRAGAPVAMELINRSGKDLASCVLRVERWTGEAWGDVLFLLFEPGDQTLLISPYDGINPEDGACPARIRGTLVAPAGTTTARPSVQVPLARAGEDLGDAPPRRRFGPGTYRLSRGMLGDPSVVGRFTVAP